MVEIRIIVMVSMKIMGPLILGLHLYLATVAFAANSNIRGAPACDSEIQRDRHLAKDNSQDLSPGLKRLRNTLAYLMKVAVPTQYDFSSCMATTGSLAKNGFTYAFQWDDITTAISKQNLEGVVDAMHNLIKADVKISHSTMTQSKL